MTTWLRFHVFSFRGSGDLTVRPSRPVETLDPSFHGAVTSPSSVRPEELEIEVDRFLELVKEPEDTFRRTGSRFGSGRRFDREPVRPEFGEDRWTWTKRPSVGTGRLHGRAGVGGVPSLGRTYTFAPMVGSW